MDIEREGPLFLRDKEEHDLTRLQDRGRRIRVEETLRVLHHETDARAVLQGALGDLGTLRLDVIRLCIIIIADVCAQAGRAQG